MNRCKDLAGDRLIGSYWENEFCKLGSDRGLSFTKHQLDREGAAQVILKWKGKYHGMPLTDVTIYTAPGQHHEIKHKDPSSKGCFGLEQYRLDALDWFKYETRQNVYYTIHNYALQPDSKRSERKANKTNLIEHWVTCSVDKLINNVAFIEKSGLTWYNGARNLVPICFWPLEVFKPLITLWEVVPSRDNKGYLI